jgi:PAS domain S-box-containing protein
VGLALLISTVSLAHAQRYHIHTYNESSGLPSSSVIAIAQGADGRMWFATRAGVSAYDGLRWEAGDPRSIGPPERVLCEWDERTHLWVVQKQSPFDVLHFDGVSWERIPPPMPAGSPGSPSLMAVGRRAASRLAIGTDDGRVFVWGDGHWVGIAAESLPPREITALAIDGDRVLAASSSGVVALTEGREPVTIASTLGRAVDGMAREVAGGGVWLVGRDWIGLLAGDDLRIVAAGLTLPEPLDPRYPIVAPDGRGALYLGYMTYVARFDPERGLERLDTHSGLAAAGATTMYRDREGDVWIGSPRGASKIVSLRFANYGREHGLFNDEVTAVVERRPGEIVLGHVGGLSLWGDPIRTLRLTDEHEQGRVLDLAADGSGRVWIAVENRGFARLDPDDGLHWYDGALGNPRSVVVDGGGRLWAASSAGLFVERGGALSPVELPAGTGVSIRRLFRAPSGGLYVATSEEGLLRFEGSTLSRWTAGDDSGANNVYAVLEDPDGTVWAGTSAGLWKARGRALVKAEAPGPQVDRPVYFLTRDGGGRLWIGTDDGVLRWDGGAMRHYTVEHGLVGREANRAAGIADSSGWMWFGMDRGLSIYRPELDHPNTVPPTVDLLDIEVGDRRVPMSSPVTLAHAESTLVFRFRAISFVDEGRVLVRSRLEGFDRDWLAPYSDPRGMIRYTNLPPGSYRFDLQAANLDGVWSEVARSAPIVIRAPVWQQPWFVLLGIAAAMAVVYGAYRFAAQRRYARTLEREVRDKLAALRLSEERLREVQEAEMRRLDLTLGSIADGVIATDPSGKVLLINPAACAITGWSPLDAVGRPAAEVLPLRTRGDPGTAIDPTKILDAGGRGRRDTVLVHVRGGESRRIEVNGAPMMETEHQPGGVVLAFRDVTEQLRTEEDVARTSRLEALGVLAGGIAHDFNNLMTVMLGCLSLLKLDGEVGMNNRANLASAEAAVLRARDLTQQLLTFSRGGAPVRHAASLAEVIEESASFVAHGTNVRCHIDLPTDLWVVEFDPGQMSQVINNLLINAAEAMPKGGVVRIAGRNLERGPATLPAGRYVEISIRDHGHGIPAEQVDRIFDPYFSTKQRGSGLGLATAYSIVSRHDGVLTVESVLGRGATFRILLPAAPAQVVETRAADVAVPGGRGRVLVMDDEPKVREVIGAMLERLGYTVAEADDGDRAVALYRQAMERSRRFDAVIMDLTVPGGKGGRETIREILELDPDARAIVASGYSNDPVMADHERHGFRGCLTKPFYAAQLSKVVRQVIEAPDAQAR